MLVIKQESFEKAKIIAEEVCKAGGISVLELRGRKKTTLLNTLRGLCQYLSWEFCIHPTCMAEAINRSRANIINQSKRYWGYIQTGDKLSMKIYLTAKTEIEKRFNKRDEGNNRKC